MKENQDGGGEEMGSVEDMSSASSSGASVPAAADRTAGELGEGHAASTPVGNGIPNRYRQILQEQRDQLSDSSSVDNAPRRAASPMGSTLSLPDDAASAQVRSPIPKQLRAC
ncbi:hypothetical protein IMZ48_48395 [Candidatus Bathyarchaeota archaeon]|nr:hypothetical protein [Candidatus Bathyarchaeota archaeon]